MSAYRTTPTLTTLTLSPAELLALHQIIRPQLLFGSHLHIAAGQRALATIEAAVARTRQFEAARKLLDGIEHNGFPK